VTGRRRRRRGKLLD